MRMFWTNRTACNVLDELRTLVKVDLIPERRGMYLSLIEELQVMYNKMEAALNDARDIVEINKERHQVKSKFKKLKTDYQTLVDKYKELGGNAPPEDE